MKKLIIFGLIKKIIIFVFLFSTTLHAEGDYSGVHFSDYEENATIFLCNNYSYQDLKDILISSSTAKNIVRDRIDSPYTSVSDIDSVSGVNKSRLHYLKQASHLVDWSLYSDEFGMSKHQTNFIYALSAVLIGFTFLFFSIFALITKV